MDTEGEREFDTVPLPLGQGLPSCLRTAASLGEDSWGVVPYDAGFAVRVPRAERERVTRQLRPDDAALVLGKCYDVRSTPPWNFYSPPSYPPWRYSAAKRKIRRGLQKATRFYHFET